MEKTEYVLQEHVKYLESAGARVVPVSFLLPKEEMISLLGNLNGVYAPGDNKAILENKDYSAAMKTLMNFAKEENEAYESIPLVFSQWSFLSLMKSVSPSAHFEKLQNLLNVYVYLFEDSQFYDFYFF